MKDRNICVKRQCPSVLQLVTVWKLGLVRSAIWKQTMQLYLLARAATELSASHGNTEWWEEEQMNGDSTKDIVLREKC